MEGKLVRDMTPEVIRQSGEQRDYHTLQDDAEFRQALVEALIEKMGELSTNPTLENRAEIAELLMATDELFGFEPVEVEAVRRDIADQLGGFRRRIYLEEEHDG